MSREKPDRATCIYVPEPDGPVQRDPSQSHKGRDGQQRSF